MRYLIWLNTIYIFKRVKNLSMIHPFYRNKYRSQQVATIGDQVQKF